jgi:hypothetical protein
MLIQNNWDVKGSGVTSEVGKKIVFAQIGTGNIKKRTICKRLDN